MVKWEKSLGCRLRQGSGFPSALSSCVDLGKYFNSLHFNFLVCKMGMITCLSVRSRQMVGLNKWLTIQSILMTLSVVTKSLQSHTKICVSGFCLELIEEVLYLLQILVYLSLRFWVSNKVIGTGSHSDKYRRCNSCYWKQAALKETHLFEWSS